MESLFKLIVDEDFPNLWKELDSRHQEANRILNYLNPKRSSPRHIVLKLRINDNSQGSQGKEKVTYKGKPARLSSDFSAETLQARREWEPIFKLLKERNYQPKIIYPAKISFRYEGEIQTFSDIQKKLREFITRRPPLPEISKQVILPETKNKRAQNYEQDHQYTYSING